MKKQTITDIDLVIQTNKAKFKPGVSIKEKDFLKITSTIFGITTPKFKSTFKSAKEAHIYALQKVAAYTKLNKVLAHRGLVIRASDYYTNFHIIGHEQALDFASAKVSRSVSLVTRANTLQSSVLAFDSIYRKLSKPEIVKLQFEI